MRIKISSTRAKDSMQFRVSMCLSYGGHSIPYLAPEYSGLVSLHLVQQFLYVGAFRAWLKEMPLSVSIRTMQKPDIFLFIFLEPGHRHFSPYCRVIVTWATLKEFYFVPFDFVDNPQFISDVGWNLLLTIRSEKLFDSLCLKFG